MESDFNPTVPSAAHPESMDFLSRAWCNFAVQTLQSDQLKGHHQLSLALVDSPVRDFDSKISVSSMKMERSLKMDGGDDKFAPPWKSNDVQSWLWMHQAMHPEVNYSGFRRKWLQWKITPLKNISIKKWWNEMRQRRKEDERLQRAEVHAAISVAGVAASLAAIAAERTKKEGKTGDPVEIAVASAAALVAAQCAEVAEAMGAKKKELRSVIGSAVSGGACDILTLTAAATTSLKGAAILKARSGCTTMNSGRGAPVLPLEECGDQELDFNFERNKSILAKGQHLPLETPDGTYKLNSVSIFRNNYGKVILKIKKLNLWKGKQESVVMEMHVELYRDGEEDDRETTCYLIVLTTSRGIFKIDIGDDYQLYRTWGNTIHQMLMMSSSSSSSSSSSTFTNAYHLPLSTI